MKSLSPIQSLPVSRTLPGRLAAGPGADASFVWPFVMPTEGADASLNAFLPIPTEGATASFPGIMGIPAEGE